MPIFSSRKDGMLSQLEPASTNRDFGTMSSLERDGKDKAASGPVDLPDRSVVFIKGGIVRSTKSKKDELNDSKR